MNELRPSGYIRNPTGINQHDPKKRRGGAYAFRLPIELDERFLIMIAEKGISKTQAIQIAIALWCESN